MTRKDHRRSFRITGQQSASTYVWGRYSQCVSEAIVTDQSALNGIALSTVKNDSTSTVVLSGGGLWCRCCNRKGGDADENKNYGLVVHDD